MNSGSLRLRLLLAAAAAIAVASLLAGSGFYLTFRKYAERLAARELEDDFVQLASGIRIGDDGTIKSRAILSDPRFEKPYGGIYWQINEQGRTPLTSQSLFDVELPDTSKSNAVVQVITGPEGSKLFSLHKQLVLPLSSGRQRVLSVVMAIDRTEIDNAAEDFRKDLQSGLALLSLALLASSALQVIVGLAPLQALRRSVERIVQGQSNRVEGRFPSEVMPLVSGLNDLLHARDGELERARQRASNLAHGLKTPLMVLNTVADQVESNGNGRAANDIRDNAAQISALITRQLARARLASGEARALTEVRPVVERLTKAMHKAHLERGLAFLIAVPEASRIAIEATDLLELLGNLVENACKWARSTVKISYDHHVLTVEDDGPGVPPDKFAEIQERGVRLDESVKGTGLGLAIVRDLIEAYGMAIHFERSSLGGLSVSIGKPLSFQN